MTLHIVYNHKCPECSAYYIPYDKDIPCPRCGLVEKGRYDYISRVLDSMKYNKDLSGCYTPGAWWSGSLGDHILFILFGVFDEFERTGESANFARFANESLSEMQWGDQDYLCGHVQGIAMRIHRELYTL